LCDQFSGMLFPVAMAFGADGDRHALKRTLIEGNRIALVLVTGASVCLIGFSGPLIRGWMGPAFGGSVAPFIVLALAGAIVVSQAASPNVLIALGSHRLVTCVWIGEAAINLMLSVVLVRTMGLVGVAVGTLVPLIVGHLFVMQTAACRKVGVPITSYAYQTGRGAAIAGAVATCACAALRLMYPPASAVTVIAEGALVGSVYIVSLATIGFDRETRSSYGSLIASVFRGLSSALAVKGNRATKVDPEEPLSASVSVP
jgi:O-antigen/teichoic acid export membrane protein